MDEKFVEMNEKFDKKFVEMNEKFDEMDAKFDEMDAKFDKMDAKLDAMDARFDKMDEDLRRISTKVDVIEGKIDVIEEIVERNHTDLRSVGGIILTKTSVPLFDNYDHNADTYIPLHLVLQQLRDWNINTGSLQEQIEQLGCPPSSLPRRVP